MFYNTQGSLSNKIQENYTSQSINNSNSNSDISININDLLEDEFDKNNYKQDIDIQHNTDNLKDDILKNEINKVKIYKQNDQNIINNQNHLELNNDSKKYIDLNNIKENNHEEINKSENSNEKINQSENNKSKNSSFCIIS